MITRIAILTIAFDHTLDVLAAKMNLEVIKLRWSGILQLDVKALENSGAQLLVAEYDPTHHGLRVARAAIRGLGIDAVMFSRGVHGWITEDNQFPQDPGLDCPVLCTGDAGEVSVNRILAYIKEGGYATASNFLKEQLERVEQASENEIARLENEIARLQAALDKVRNDGRRQANGLRLMCLSCHNHALRIRARQAGERVQPAEFRPELNEKAPFFPPGTYRVESASYYPEGLYSNRPGGRLHPNCSNATVRICPSGRIYTEGFRAPQDRRGSCFPLGAIRTTEWILRGVNPQGDGPATLYLASKSSDMSCHLASNEPLPSQTQN